MPLNFIELTEVTHNIVDGRIEVVGKITIPLNLIGKLQKSKNSSSKKNSKTTSILFLNFSTERVIIEVAEDYENILNAMKKAHNVLAV